MAKCDEGYVCQICGKYVENVTESDLYLRYVIGEVDPELLHTIPDKHIRCNPTLAQFIVSEDFDPVVDSGDFCKSNLDSQFVAQREQLVTRGWQRLLEIKSTDLEAILEFPLPEIIEKYSGKMDSRSPDPEQ